MILLFPNLDTLYLALSKEIAPREVTLAPAAITIDDQGRIYVESTVPLSKTVAKSLDRIGVKGSKRHGSDAPQVVGSWVQILPLTKEREAATLSPQAAVLFEVSNSEDLPKLITEMLRLGNDRQSVRWLSTTGENASNLALLRVIGPPYYTLLRALDNSTAGSTNGIRAYVEGAPRIWIELGYTHPLVNQLRIADDQIVLIRSPREWTTFDNEPFQDVYDITQFELPVGSIEWEASTAPTKLTVPLRLAPGNATDVAELWVLRDDGVSQLDSLVRDADERLTQRLMFAVATDTRGARSVILRTRPSKLAPPVLTLEKSLGFKPLWKLPNLYLPVGTRLHPTLRREAVRQLLADDADQVVWLYPNGQGMFTPESIPDEAFRALNEWVDYVIEAAQEPLAAWIDATRFNFDHYICKDTTGPSTKPDNGDKQPHRSPAPPKQTPRTKTSNKLTSPTEFLPPIAETKPPSEWKLKQIELEKKFLAIEGTLDAPERQALWPELAVVNTGTHEYGEAALCWLHALWDTDDFPADWLAGWVRAEFPTHDGAYRADNFDRLLTSKNPSITDARSLIAVFLWIAHQSPTPSWLTNRLPAIQKFLETHEGLLPIRAVWLAGYRLAQLAGKDVLGLARVRDRILQRLLDRGLEPERDQPYFLRSAGQQDSERLRVIRNMVMDLHQSVRKWSDHIPQNLPYIDLYFAYALAKLSEVTSARNLADAAGDVMLKSIPTSAMEYKNLDRIIAAISDNYLYRAFRYRVDQVILGKPHTGQLSEELIDEFDAIDKKSQSDEFKLKGPNSQSENPFGRAGYVISRMRDFSRILEPQGGRDPYTRVTRYSDTLRKELAELLEIRDTTKLADRIRRLYKQGIKDRPLAEIKFSVLYEALPLAPRVGESFAVELLTLVPSTLTTAVAGGPGFDYSDVLEKIGKLLERALFLAAHYDRGEIARALIVQFTDLVRSRFEAARHKPDQAMAGFQLINVVAGQALRSLRKLAPRDEIDHFFSRLQKEALRGASLAELRKQYSGKPEAWSTVLQTMLNLSAGWLVFGMYDNAAPILDTVRKELLNPNGSGLPAKDYTKLARAYVTALGQGPSEVGVPRIAELFQKMEPDRINNTFTTSPHYSRFHLNLVEDVILAIVSDEFALGPAGRRWLDDDEYLVRRRIHADMKRHLEKSGL